MLPTSPSSPHPWLDLAWADLGTLSGATPTDDDRVHGYFTAVGHPEITGDPVAWCAAFVGACLERAGLASTRSLLARSYIDYGSPLEHARPGAIAIFSRGPDPGVGHVAFVVGEAGTDGLIVLGGNQSHAVSVIVMPRARLLTVRWPPQPASAPTANAPPAGITAPADADPAFEHALAHVLGMEGGYSNDPFDPGGPTNLGITQADLAAYRSIPDTPGNAERLKHAVAALAPGDVAPIYRAFYWDRCEAPNLPPPLAFFHFDTAVNHGIGSAARMLQRALGVDCDGEIGPLTLGAAAACEPAKILDAYATIRRARYRSLPTFWRFGRGWLARVDSTEAAARELLSDPPHNPTQEPSMPSSSQPTAAPSAAAPANASSPTTAFPAPKWWGESVTIWGTIVTGFAAVLPIVGPLLGIDISAEMVHQLGDGVVHAGQAVASIVGLLMTIYGRTRAVQPLVRRDFMVKF